MQLTLSVFQIALIVMIAETAIVLVLFVGWYFGSRQMKYTMHHGAVYSIVLVHTLTVALWMIPVALLLVPLGNLFQTFHDAVGFLAVSLGAILVVLFLVRRGMPLKLLKKTRPIMILTLILWAVAFLSGLMSFIISYLL